MGRLQWRLLFPLNIKLGLGPLMLWTTVFFVVVTCYVSVTCRRPTSQAEVKIREMVTNWAPFTYTNGWRHNLTVCGELRRRFHRKDFQRRQLQYKVKPIAIYTLDPAFDSISNQIVISKTYEPKAFKIVYNLIGRFPDVDFIDIGANLGAFALQMADTGKRVIAIETSKDFVQHLCASVQDNQLQNKITIIHNVISDKHEEHVFEKDANFKRAGRLVKYNETKRAMFAQYDVSETERYQSMILDDLLEFHIFKNFQKRVFIKIDVHGYEDSVIRGGFRFLTDIEVIGIYMEWNQKQISESGREVVEEMKKNGFEGYTCDHEKFNEYITEYPLKNPCVLLTWEELDSKRTSILWILAGLKW